MSEKCDMCGLYKGIAITLFLTLASIFGAVLYKANTTPRDIKLESACVEQIEMNGQEYNLAHFVYEYKTPDYTQTYRNFNKYELIATHFWKHHDVNMQPTIVSCIVSKVGPAEDTWYEKFPKEDYFWCPGGREDNQDICKYDLLLENNTKYNLHIFIGPPSFVKARTIGASSDGDQSAVFDEEWYRELVHSDRLEVQLW